MQLKLSLFSCFVFVKCLSFWLDKGFSEGRIVFFLFSLSIAWTSCLSQSPAQSLLYNLVERIHGGSVQYPYSKFLKRI